MQSRHRWPRLAIHCTPWHVAGSSATTRPSTGAAVVAATAADARRRIMDLKETQIANFAEKALRPAASLARLHCSDRCSFVSAAPFLRCYRAFCPFIESSSFCFSQFALVKNVQNAHPLRACQLTIEPPRLPGGHQLASSPATAEAQLIGAQ